MKLENEQTLIGTGFDYVHVLVRVETEMRNLEGNFVGAVGRNYEFFYFEMNFIRNTLLQKKDWFC